MAPRFCFLFSQKTGSIMILSFPVMCILQFCIASLYLDTGSCPKSDGWKVMSMLIILFMICFVGLLGVEQENPTFLIPALWMLFVIFIVILLAQIEFVLNYFQLTHFKDTFETSQGLMYSVVFNGMQMHSFRTIFDHYTELRSSQKLHKLKQIDV